MRAKPMNIENYDVSLREYKAFRKHACDLASILFLNCLITNIMRSIPIHAFVSRDPVDSDQDYCFMFGHFMVCLCVCNVKSHAQLETSQAEPNRTEPNCLFLIFIAHFFDRDQSHREKKVLDALKMKMISDKIDYQINRV